MEDVRQHISKKALEVCYALIRIAGSAPSESFKSELERQAISLLAVSVSERYAESVTNLRAIKIFLILGLELNYISAANSEILEKQLNEINSAIAESRKVSASLREEINLDGVFSGTKYSAMLFGENDKIESAGSTAQITADKETSKDEADALIGNRQSAIIDIVRQYSFAGKNGCQMRDIQNVLPGVSERTIRYDLHKLIEKGVISRIGAGAASSYTINQSNSGE